MPRDGPIISTAVNQNIRSSKVSEKQKRIFSKNGTVMKLVESVKSFPSVGDILPFNN